jgi:hypothetical protein
LPAIAGISREPRGERIIKMWKVGILEDWAVKFDNTIFYRSTESLSTHYSIIP